MKKGQIAVLLLFFAFSLLAFCPADSNRWIQNGGIPCASGLSSDPSKVHAYLWIQGKADWTTDGTAQVATGNCAAGGTTGGCDSDGLGSVDASCAFLMEDILVPWRAECIGEDIPGAYGVFQTWETGSFDGCPSADSSERAVLLIYDDTGKYVLQSRSQGAGGWAGWDEIGTTVAAQLSAWTASGTEDNPACLSWSGDEVGSQADIYLYPLDDSIKYGAYASGDVPSSSLVTAFRLYFQTGCDGPTDFSTASWIPGLSYPVSTTKIDNYTFPDSSTGLWMSRALIIDGKELPFVSTSYVSVLPEPYWGTPSDSLCSCELKFYNEFEPWIFSEDALVDGTELILGACGDPWFYYGTCNVEHTIQFRSKIYGWNLTSCWSAPQTIYDTYVEPEAPVITSIVDNDPNAQTGLTFNFTPASPSSGYCVFRDGKSFADISGPGATLTGTDCEVPHTYYLLSYYTGDSSCWTYSNSLEAIDHCAGAPGEIAVGATIGDALVFSTDKTALSWPSYADITGYKIYRGVKAGLSKLVNGTTNSCLKYNGTATSTSISSDDPSGISGRFYWYLITAYNGAGEGPAGTGRIINSSGACP